MTEDLKIEMRFSCQESMNFLLSPIHHGLKGKKPRHTPLKINNLGIFFHKNKQILHKIIFFISHERLYQSCYGQNIPTF